MHVRTTREHRVVADLNEVHELLAVTRGRHIQEERRHALDRAETRDTRHLGEQLRVVHQPSIAVESTEGEQVLRVPPVDVRLVELAPRQRRVHAPHVRPLRPEVLVEGAFRGTQRVHDHRQHVVAPQTGVADAVHVAGDRARADEVHVLVEVAGERLVRVLRGSADRRIQTNRDAQRVDEQVEVIGLRTRARRVLRLDEAVTTDDHRTLARRRRERHEVLQELDVVLTAVREPAEDARVQVARQNQKDLVVERQHFGGRTHLRVLARGQTVGLLPGARTQGACRSRQRLGGLDTVHVPGRARLTAVVIPRDGGVAAAPSSRCDCHAARTPSRRSSRQSTPTHARRHGDRSDRRTACKPCPGRPTLPASRRS